MEVHLPTKWDKIKESFKRRFIFNETTYRATTSFALGRQTISYMELRNAAAVQ
jgi:hypothetical protein